MSFIPGELYHVYNRGNNREPIFFEEDNYFFFLSKIGKKVVPYCDLLAYCLLPNHYHLLIHVPEDTGLPEESGLNPLARKLGTLQSSYTQAINKRFNRTGSLFQAKLKRKCATEYGLVCLHYIHQNPVKAGLVAKMEDWPFSSFTSYLSQEPHEIVNKKCALEFLDIPLAKEDFVRESYGVIIDPRLENLIL